MEKANGSNNKGTILRKKIRIRSFLVLMIGILAVFSGFFENQQRVQAAPTSSLFFDPSSLESIAQNDTFSLNIKVNPGADQVSGVDLKLSFDPAKLQIVEEPTVNVASFPMTLSNVYDNNTGTAYIASGIKLSPRTPITSEVVFVTLNFRFIGTGQANILINNNSFVTSLNEINNIINSASPAVIGTAEPEKKYSIIDFTVLVADWMQTKVSSADVNIDGTVNSRDLGIMMSNWQN